MKALSFFLGPFSLDIFDDRLLSLASSSKYILSSPGGDSSTSVVAPDAAFKGGDPQGSSSSVAEILAGDIGCAPREGERGNCARYFSHSEGDKTGDADDGELDTEDK